MKLQQHENKEIDDENHHQRIALTNAREQGIFPFHH
jgi:hypothetical protein